MVYIKAYSNTKGGALLEPKNLNVGVIVNVYDAMEAINSGKYDVVVLDHTGSRGFCQIAYRAEVEGKVFETLGIAEVDVERGYEHPITGVDAFFEDVCKWFGVSTKADYNRQTAELGELILLLRHMG